ncbi:hypothetical protein [Rhizobium sp. Rhizsp42]|uniref:hypothetical protein n=1 Tax=Rhizobium sp. Rhizsp42 TaxID=3243034 RepID=UPI0039AEC0D9
MAMDKKAFLQREYDSIVASGAPICERWRRDFASFYEDLIDATPSHASRRFLALKVPEIGFEPENVEWHFRRPPGRVVPESKKPKSRQSAKTAKPRKRATANTNAKREQAKRDEAERLKVERRRMIAEQFRQWEEKRQAKIDGSNF